MTIFGNEIRAADERKACRTQKKFVRKFGDDRSTEYRLGLADNEVLTPAFSCRTIVSGAKEADFAARLPEKPVIIGNIRMGFGHYRISMAMASAAKSMGCTPLWFDLNSFPETTATKIIAYQNSMYSTASRLSQKSRLFNSLVWEPLNSEGFRKLSYNAGDQKSTELMTPLFAGIPKDTPFIATHVWPAQAAVHAGMSHVVNAVPDNWPMALHLSEGAVHTVQTHSSYWGYRTLHGFDGDKVLSPMPAADLVYTGHYIDHELVCNIEQDCARRVQRATEGSPLRFLLTIGGAGAQGDFFASIIESLLPFVRQGKACIYVNCGDYANVWRLLQKRIPALQDGGKDCAVRTHFDDWSEECAVAQRAAGATDAAAGSGIHVFCNKDIFGAVYITNLLMRAADVLVTKPSELAFYPVPKLFIRRIGGHEMWGAIHSAELGDGTLECSSPAYAASVVRLIMEDSSLLKGMCDSILEANRNGVYSGAYRAVELALAGRSV
ncbi:MAG TPA: hypothetical protein DDW78_05380 [Treponema sp.]|nr:hypothetical protein [Treponema sp.]